MKANRARGPPGRIFQPIGRFTNEEEKHAEQNDAAEDRPGGRFGRLHGGGLRAPHGGGNELSGMRAEHRRIYDAQARTEAWDFVLEILGPWVEGVDPIGSEELTRVMRGALEEAEWEFNLAQDELEAAEAAL